MKASKYPWMSMDIRTLNPYPWMDLEAPIHIHPGGWISMDGGFSSIHSEL
jgi:hypothetical protein